MTSDTPKVGSTLSSQGFLAKLGILPFSRESGYRILRLALGVLLLVTAGLKGYQLATEPTLGNSLLESRWFLIFVVEFELFFLGYGSRRLPKSTAYVFVGISYLRSLISNSFAYLCCPCLHC
jgi:hypothetical protein